MLASEAALTIDREDLLAQLDFMARRDELTGLVNRRVLRETLDEELARAAERKSALSLAILDLDSFKKVNDARGHQAGDRLLRAAAAAWGEALDVQGTIGRYGGDEFMVLLPGLDPTEGAAATERLRRVVPEGATCSAGIATWDGDPDRGPADRGRRRLPLRRQGRRPRSHRDHPGRRSRLAASIQLNKPRRAA